MYLGPVLFTAGRDSSVGIVTDYGLDVPGSNPGRDEIFRPSRPALGPTQPPVRWVPGLSRGVKCGRGVLLTTHPLLVPLPSGPHRECTFTFTHSTCFKIRELTLNVFFPLCLI